MKLIKADDMFEYMKSEGGAVQLGHSPIRFLDVKRVIDSVPTIDAIPVEWLIDRANDPERAPLYRRYAQMLYGEWQKEQEAR